MPTTTANKVLSGIVLEANASSEYRVIAPFYYEQYLKDRYSNGADGRKCFDILRDSVVYDLGRITQLADVGCKGYWSTCFSSGGKAKFDNSFANTARGNLSSQQTNLKIMLDKLALYVDN